MPSIYVSWRGTCVTRQKQEELTGPSGFLRALAERCRMREQRFVKRPRMLDILAAQRGPAPVIPVIRSFDEKISGRILLDPYLVSNLERLQTETQRTKMPAITVEPGGDVKQETGCLSIGSQGGQMYLCLTELRVHGIDFQLYDPRGLYPDANRMSFVFLESSTLPALNGCIAMVENREQCRIYGGEAIRSADWLVSTASIHLRYCREEWSDRLLGWVKYFFIPDLFFQRWEPMTHYEGLRAVFDEHCSKWGVQAAKEFAFDVLLDEFESESHKWIKDMAGW